MGMLLTGLVLASGAAQAEPRSVVSLDRGWDFQQGTRHATVDLPHTWNRLGNAGTTRSPLTDTVQGVGWYRLKFAAPVRKTRRYFLEFDGVGALADVWLNGRHLGRHAGAFARFRFDATAALRASGENLLEVKADNSRPLAGSSTENIIPLSGDFFVFGGIYRNVRLVSTNAEHIDMMDYGGPGVYAHAVSISPYEAVVEVRTKVVGAGARVDTEIDDAEGNMVAAGSGAAADDHRVREGATPVDTVTATLRVPHPHLWRGVRDPYLYHTVVTLRSRNGALLDRVTQPLGLRTIAFDPNKGFFLNGEHLFLRGASLHQDRPVKGWAISPEDQAQDFDALVDLGANAVRLAHYQHDQVSYDLADARGIVAWAEIPLVNQVSFNGGPADAALTANASQQLVELIRQNYNHPSIALWSIANEIDLRMDASGEHGIARPLLESLNALAKKEDPSRFTTMADCCEPTGAADEIGPRANLVGITDTVGYNRYFGWYSRTMAELGPALDAMHARHPTLPIAISEYGAGAALTQHSDNPAGGPIEPHGRPHPEELQNLFHEQTWKTLAARPYLWGAFIWNLFDFASDSRREGDLTDINDKGLITYDRAIRKDAFYFYKANWSSQPTLHLVGRRYVARPYAVLDVEAYSNATQVRLRLNGKDLGSAPCADGICWWRGVHLEQGNNELSATALQGLSDSLHWTFNGSPQVVHIKVGDLSGMPGYGSDMYFEGGVGKGVNPPDTPAAQRVNVPAPFDHYREGAFTYRIPVPDGRYRVTLRFIEPTVTAKGGRVFDVLIGGRKVLSNFDVLAAAGGRLKGIERSFTTRGGPIVIELKPDAVLSSLSVEPE